MTDGRNGDDSEPGAAPPARVTLYWPAIWRASITAMTFAIPIAVLQTWLVDSDRLDKGDPFNLVLYFAIMCTGALGGYAAAKLAPASPLQNGAAAAALAAIVIQAGADVKHAFAGERLAGPVVWIFLALLLAIFGMFGAWVEIRTSPPRNGATHP